MPICKPETLPDALPPAGRLAGLDVGQSSVGVAISDPSLTIASPRTTLRRGRRFKDIAAALFDLLDEANVEGLVVGLPLGLDGKPGPRVQASRGFATNLLKLRDLPCAFWDERMSTNAVERQMLEADMSRARRSAIRDAAAAAFILQGYLDFLRDSGAASNFGPV